MEPEERRSTAGSERGISEEVDGGGLAVGFAGGRVLRVVNDEREGPCTFCGGCGYLGLNIFGCCWGIGGYPGFGIICGGKGMG